MELYGVYLTALVFVNVLLAYHRHRNDKIVESKESLALPVGDGKAAASRFKWDYFSVYGLVVAADWLQVCNGIVET